MLSRGVLHQPGSALPQSRIQNLVLWCKYGPIVSLERFFVASWDSLLTGSEHRKTLSHPLQIWLSTWIQWSSTCLFNIWWRIHVSEIKITSDSCLMTWQKSEAVKSLLHSVRVMNGFLRSEWQHPEVWMWNLTFPASKIFCHGEHDNYCWQKDVTALRSLLQHIQYFSQPKHGFSKPLVQTLRYLEFRALYLKIFFLQLFGL